MIWYIYNMYIPIIEGQETLEMIWDHWRYTATIMFNHYTDHRREKNMRNYPGTQQVLWLMSKNHPSYLWPHVMSACRCLKVFQSIRCGSKMRDPQNYGSFVNMLNQFAGFLFFLAKKQLSSETCGFRLKLQSLATAVPQAMAAYL